MFRSLYRTTHQAENNRPIILTGPASSGKTRIIKEASKDLAKQGKTVIFLDVKCLSTFDDYVSLFQLETLKSVLLSKRSFNLSKKETFSNVFFNETNRSSHILVGSHELHERGVDLYFDSFIKYNDIFHFVLIIHHFDHLRTFDEIGHLYFDTFLIKTLRSDLNFPIILGFSNQPLASSLNDVFDVVYTPDLSKYTANIMNSREVFSLFEHLKISMKLGHVGGIGSRIYDDLKFNVNLDQSISKELNQTYMAILGIVPIPFPIGKKFCGFSSNKVVRAKNLYEYNLLYPLVEAGYLSFRTKSSFISPGTHITKFLCCLRSKSTFAQSFPYLLNYTHM